MCYPTNKRAHRVQDESVSLYFHAYPSVVLRGRRVVKGRGSLGGTMTPMNVSALVIVVLRGLLT